MARRMDGYSDYVKGVSPHCHDDNMAVVACNQSVSSRDHLVIHMLHSLWLISAYYKFDPHPRMQKYGSRGIVQILPVSFDTDQSISTLASKQISRHAPCLKM